MTVKNKTSGELIALGLLSAAIIAFQLVLMQLLSQMQWYHFAYMVISIAMLGFGAAGTALALLRSWFLTNEYRLVPVLMALTGMLMILSFRAVRLPYLQFDVYLLFAERRQFWVLAANYLVFFLPFFTGALAIGVIFIKNPSTIGKYYFANLLGSGFGGLVMVFVFNIMFAIQALPLAAVFSVAASLVYIKKSMALSPWNLPSALAILLLVIALFSPGYVPMSEYKGLPKTLLLPDAEIQTSKPDVSGRIDVVFSPQLRYAPAVSLSYNGQVPVKRNIFSNGDFYAVIPVAGDYIHNIHNFTTDALPYVTGERKNVLVADAAAGVNAAFAFHRGAEQVVSVVETNAVKKLLEGKYAKESGWLFADPRHKVVYQSSRQYIFSANENYFDAIILPAVESFGGSVGLNAISENYLFTLEAFDKMWDLLSEDGVIVVTSWLDYPPRTTLRLLASLVDVMNSRGVENLRDQIVAVRSWGTITIMAAKSPFNRYQMEEVKSFCETMFFDPVILPGHELDDIIEFNQMEDGQLLEYIDLILSGETEEFFREYDFHIAPVVDNAPYFERFLRARDIPRILSGGDSDLIMLEIGYVIVWVTLLQALVLAFLFIILPLFRTRSTSKGKIWVLLYFASLGLGYMFVEIIFIQRLILYFGHPIYAIAAVISVMMISSGMGSLLSNKFADPSGLAIKGNLAVLTIIIVYLFLLTPTLMNTIHMNPMVKIFIAFFVISVPSFFMGMPFPSGIRILDPLKADLIPWAFGINGSLSVIATSLATLIAVENGFRVVMLSAGVLYFIAFMVALRVFAREGK